MLHLVGISFPPIPWPMTKPDSFWWEQESGGIRRNPVQIQEFLSHRYSCKKIFWKRLKTGIFKNPPKPRSCEEILNNNKTGKKETLRNPGRNGFWGSKKWIPENRNRQPLAFFRHGPSFLYMCMHVPHHWSGWSSSDFWMPWISNCVMKIINISFWATPFWQVVYFTLIYEALIWTCMINRNLELFLNNRNDRCSQHTVFCQLLSHMHDRCVFEQYFTFFCPLFSCK